MVPIIRHTSRSMLNPFSRGALATIILMLSLAVLGPAQAQDEDEEYYLNLLQTEVEVENPVYKPVMFLGSGVLHFLGDVRNPSSNPLVGEFGYRASISRFIGKNNFFRLNVFFLYGRLSGHNFEISRLMQSVGPVNSQSDPDRPYYINSAFSTELFAPGIGIEYGFGHLVKIPKRFNPFISLGLSVLQFSPKGSMGLPGFYHFWSDGIVRDQREFGPFHYRGRQVEFQTSWDTDLQLHDFHGIGRYSQTTAMVPVEVGFDFYLSYRVNLRVSTSLHYTFSDLIDNYNSVAAQRYASAHNGRNDAFMFTNFSINLDLFSDPKYQIIEREFLELEYFDYDVMFADQDGDGVFDRFDMCPDSPIGLVVDSLGCPFDLDMDGVPDFADLEASTPLGAFVDDKGQQISPDRIIEMYQISKISNRNEIRTIPIPPAWTRSITFTPGEIPQKFRGKDLDGDGYISFSELLRAVERFFNQQTELTLEDMYELNSFFFSQ